MEEKQGLYAIFDLSADKAYVGSSVNREDRIRNHENLLKRGKHPNYKLQQAFSRGHQLEIVTLPLDEEIDILQAEQALLDEFMPKGILYNLALDATAPMKGKKHSLETLEKMRQSTTGFRHTPETVEKLRVLAKERGVSRLTIEAGAKARLGKPLSPEHREKVGIASKERMTEIAREHLRQVNLGNEHSDESIERMKQIKRANSGCSISIEGRIFGSIAEAVEVLSIGQSTVRYRLNSPSFKDWIDLNKDQNVNDANGCVTHSNDNRS